MNSDEQFKKIEALVTSRGLTEFTPGIRFRYFNDPLIYALFNLVLELFENQNSHLANWDPWEDE